MPQNKAEEQPEELRLDGVNAFVMTVKNGGQFIVVSGWTNHWRFEEGKNIILLDPKANTTTRYMIKKVRRPGDPPDMYFLDLEFNPRAGLQPDYITHCANRKT